MMPYRGIKRSTSVKLMKAVIALASNSFSLAHVRKSLKRRQGAACFKLPLTALVIFYN